MGSQDSTNLRYKVLIVDDDRDVLQALATLIGKAGGIACDIALAENGKEAIIKLKNQEFDLVLSDYKMPGMNGIELLSYVKNLYPKTARMLITAYSDVNVARDAINKAAVHGYIEKPWDNDEAMHAIHDTLIHRTGREAGVLRVNSEDAARMLKVAKSEVLRDTSGRTTRQMMLEFDSITEFNKFSLELKNIEGAYVEDIRTFKNTYIITISIRP